MNTKIKLSIFALIALFGLFAVTTPAAAMTCNSATLTGTVNTGTPPTKAWFEYDDNYSQLSQGLGIVTSEVSGSPFIVQGTYPVEKLISGLSPSTTYYYRLIVSNNVNNYTPLNIQNFTTPACSIPPANPPTVTFNASPTSMTYPAKTTTLTWSSTDASTCWASANPANSGWNSNNNAGKSGTITLSNLVLGSNTFSLYCTSSTGVNSATINRTVVVNQAQAQNPTVSLTANPSSIQSGQSSTLSWSSNNADYCSASWTTSSSKFGDKSVSPTNTTTYNITCYGANGTTPANSSATITVAPQQTLNSTIYLKSILKSSCSASGGTEFSGVKIPIRNPNNLLVYGGTTYSGNSFPVWVVGNYSAETPSGYNSNYQFCGYSGSPAYFNVNDQQEKTITANFTNTYVPPEQPTVSLTANPSSIQYGGNSTLTWVSAHASSCSAYWTSDTSANGHGVVNPASTTTYTITCYGASGTTPAVSSATVIVQAAATCQDPSATNYGGPLPCRYPAQVCQDPSATNYGGALPCRYPAQVCQDPSATNYGGALPCQYPQNPTGNLAVSPSTCTIAANQSTCTTGATWNTTNANSPALVDQNTNNTLSTSANQSSSFTVWVAWPQTTFNLKNNGNILSTKTAYATCASGTSWNGTICVTNISQNPTVNLSANPSSVQYGGSSTLTWYSQYANSCSLSQYGNVNTSDSRVVYPSSTTTYTITCYGTNGQQVSDYVTVYVNQIQTQYPTVHLTADDTNINYNDGTTIRWSSSYADSCHATSGGNGWAGYRNTSGSFYTGDLTNTTTFYINCSNSTGSALDSITVHVDNNNDYNDGPNVTTRNATNIGNSNATLNGRVDGNGSSTRAWFEYGTNYNLGYSTSQTSYGSGSTTYSKSISGLQENTTYYFRAVAENSYDTVYGDIFSFKTNGGYIFNFVDSQPTVVLYADQASVPYNGAATVRWLTTNATSCSASGGSAGWAGARSIGPGSFYTGSLTSSKVYSIVCSNSVGSATDSVSITVRGQTIITNSNPVVPTSLVLISSSVDRNQPIVPTIDNTRPHPGDEINYVVNYQNIGTGSITNLTLQMYLPAGVDYMFSTPSNPIISGNTLIFNLGTLKANGVGTVTTRVRVRNDIPAGTNLNFPATLSYIDPSGRPQTVSANVSAQVWSEPTANNSSILGANVFGAGFLPTNIFGWLILFILVLVLILLVRYAYSGQQPFSKKTVTTTIHQ